MRKSAPFKPIDLSSKPNGDSWYMVNEEEGKAIQIPSKMVKVFTKIAENRDPFIPDLLAMIIKYRRLADVYDSLERWEKDSRWTNFPDNSIHTQIYKLLGSIRFSTLETPLTSDEADELELFIFRCPKGYNLDRFITAHSEFKPIIT